MPLEDHRARKKESSPGILYKYISGLSDICACLERVKGIVLCSHSHRLAAIAIIATFEAAPTRQSAMIGRYARETATPKAKSS